MLAERTQKASASPTSALIARIAQLRAEGRDIISFNVGEPDLPTPKYICDAAKAAMDRGETHYTPNPGIIPLRKAILRKLKEDNGLEYGMPEIDVTVGAKQAIYDAVMAICSEGDEVILPTPCWVSYSEMVRLAGGIPIAVPSSESTAYHLDLAGIRRAVSPRTRAIIICSPNNPTGTIYTRDELEEIGSLAVQNDFYIISDEIYEKLVYEPGVKPVSIASLSHEIKSRTVTVNGFSKAYAMTGWRVGYMAAPKEIIEAAKVIQSQSTSGTNSIAQWAALAALQGPQDDLSSMVELFRKRRKKMVDLLNTIPGIHCVMPEGAFYVLPDFSCYLGKNINDKRIVSTKELAEYLLEEALVAVVPGEAFGIAGKLRFSYSNSEENIEAGIERIKKALCKLQ